MFSQTIRIQTEKNCKNDAEKDFLNLFFFEKNCNFVEKPAEIQSSIQLACHLVRLPNSRSGGHEFESPIRRELGALTKSGKTLGVMFFLQFLSSQKSEK
jgi:hypothetical protein